MAALILTLLGLTTIISCYLLFKEKRQNTQLKQHNQQMALALDHVNACIYIKDADSRYLYANKPCLELFGVDQHALKGSPDARYFPIETVQRLRQIDLQVLEQQQASRQEVEVTDETGHTTVYLESKYPLPYNKAENKTLVGISTDITELWTLRKQLEQQAWHDGLTGLYNRLKIDQIFTEQLNLAKTQQHPFSIMLLDLDLFKAINDEYGHQVGDQVLQQVSHVIQKSCQTKSIASRWGGEEFLIVCPYMNQEQTLALANQIRLAIKSAHYPVKKTVTTSIGIATLNDDFNGDALLKRADDALYLAKNSGRDTVVCAGTDTACAEPVTCYTD